MVCTSRGFVYNKWLDLCGNELIDELDVDKYLTNYKTDLELSSKEIGSWRIITDIILLITIIQHQM